MTSYTDKKLKHKRPDITLAYKDIEKWILVDVALSGDQKIIRTEDRVERYQDLALEIKSIHRTSKVTVIPIVTVALRTISKNGKTWCRKLHLHDIIGSAQLSAILGTAHMLRKVLCL